MDIYGIKNCDTVKKALKWLDGNDRHYAFHDFKKEGVDAARLAQWESQVGWETLLNRRGTTWRRLPEDVRDNMDRESALAVMQDNPSIIKRPVVEHDGQVNVGFNADEWAQSFR